MRPIKKHTPGRREGGKGRGERERKSLVLVVGEYVGLNKNLFLSLSLYFYPHLTSTS